MLDVRLTPLSHALGLASNGRLDKSKEEVTDIDAIIAYLKANSAEPEILNPFLSTVNSAQMTQKNAV